MSVAIERGDRPAMALAIAAMIAMIVAVDRLFWRPLVVWGQRFRLDDSAGEAPATSWLLELVRRSRWRHHTRVIRERALSTARSVVRPMPPAAADAPRADSVRRRVQGPARGRLRPDRARSWRAPIWGLAQLVHLMAGLGAAEWRAILQAAGLTLHARDRRRGDRDRLGAPGGRA